MASGSVPPSVPHKERWWVKPWVNWFKSWNRGPVSQKQHSEYVQELSLFRKESRTTNADECRPCLCVCAYIYIYIYSIYRVSQEECARLREGVPYVKVYRYNPKHLYPKLNGYGDNSQRKVGASCGSKYSNLHSWYVTWQKRPWEGNTMFTVPAWRFAQSAMLRHRGAFSCIVLVTLRKTMTWVRVFL